MGEQSKVKKFDEVGIMAVLSKGIISKNEAIGALKSAEATGNMSLIAKVRREIMAICPEALK